MTDFNRTLFVKILDFYNTHPDAALFDIGYLGEEYSAEQMGRIAELMARRSDLSKNDMEVLTENIEALKNENLRKNTAEVTDISDIRKILDAKKEKQ